jgi:polygalacturonase
MKLKRILAGAGLASVVFASYEHGKGVRETSVITPITPASVGSTSSVSGSAESARSTCLVAHMNGTDDTPFITRALTQCGNESVIVFQEGITYNVWTPAWLENLSNVEIRIYGNLTLPTNMSYIQGVVGQTSNGQDASLSGYWFVISGERIKIQGNPKDEWGWIECHGQQWWNLMSPNYTVPNRPHFLSLTANNTTVDHLKVSQQIAWGIGIQNSENIYVTNTRLQSISDNPWILPFNTDGFDVSGNNITIEDTVVHNGDDCIAMQAGLTNFVFRNALCVNSHGVSIGSLGQNQSHYDVVQNVTVENVYMKNTLYGARFKAWKSSQGLVKNVVYRNFITENCTIPIFVTQSYWDQQSAQTRQDTNTSVSLEDFHFERFTGSINGVTQYAQVDPSGTWWDVPGLTGRDGIVMMCPTVESCSGLNFKDIDLRADFDGSNVTEVWCQNGISSSLGFNCVNGTLVFNN